MKQNARHSYEEALVPYTKEELHQRIVASERDFAEGRFRDIEELFREWDDEEAMHHAAEPVAEYDLCNA